MRQRSLASAAIPGVATNWKQIAIPALPPFKPQQPKRVVLPNGMVVFLTENHELPLISGLGNGSRRLGFRACG